MTRPLPPEPAADDRDARMAALLQELSAKDEHLQTSREELESSNEELQSVNEELASVNTALQTKVADLSRANNDMNNLLAGTGIGTVFVDHGLRILRFTPAATQIINLIQSDVGRPLAHLVSNLRGYDRLVADTQNVLDTLMHKEREVQTSAGQWYTLRIQPYCTLNSAIEGAVISFFDISVLVKTRNELAQSRGLQRLGTVLRDASDAITVQDLAGRTLAWNPGATRLYGWDEAEALALNVRDRIPPALRAKALERLAQLSRAETLQPDRTQRLGRDGAVVEVSVISTALVGGDGQMYAIATTERALPASSA